MTTLRSVCKGRSGGPSNWEGATGPLAVRSATRKGQTTLEALLVLAAFFAFLAIWAPLSESVRERMMQHADGLEASSALSRVAYAAEEAFLLGNGNAREVRVEALAGKALRVSDGTLEAGGSSATGRFKAMDGEIAVPEGGKMTVSCCTADGDVEFRASTALP